MKMLLVSDIFPPKTGGSGRWFSEIYRRLPPAQVVVAAGMDPRAEAFDRTHELRMYRVPLEMHTRAVRSLAGLKGYWRGVRHLWPLVRRENIGRIHAARCLPEGLMALALRRLRGVPYLCYAHGEELGTASTSRELTWLTRKVLRGCDFIVANSQNTRRILHEEWQVPAGKLRVLHPGADTERFQPAARCGDVRERLGWADRPVVLTVGRLQKRKGHDTMIRALPAVRQAVPDVLYAIVGEGEERALLERLRNDLGVADHVQFIGEPPDGTLVQCYQQCDLFVLPNRTVGKDIEGFGMVLVEAQACGKPVVAGASGGTAETMDVPHTGVVVPCDTPDELAKTVRDLLLDPDRRARMGAAARPWVVSRFDWSSLARQAETVLGAAP